MNIPLVPAGWFAFLKSFSCFSNSRKKKFLISNPVPGPSRVHGGFSMLERDLQPGSRYCLLLHIRGLPAVRGKPHRGKAAEEPIPKGSSLGQAATKPQLHGKAPGSSLPGKRGDESTQVHKQAAARGPGAHPHMACRVPGAGSGWCDLL